MYTYIYIVMNLKFCFRTSFFDCTHRENFSEFGQSKMNINCNCTSPIDLTPKLLPFGAKSIGKW